MECERIRENLLAYLDGEVSDEARAAIEAHLAGCEECAAELAALKALQGDLWDAIPAGLEPLRLNDAASARIQARLERARVRQERRARGGVRAGLGGLLRGSRALVKVAVPILTLIAVLVVSLVARPPAPVHAQETIVVLPETLAPDTEAALRVIVRQAGTDAPISDAELEVHLRPRGGDVVRLYSGRTGDEGSADVRFRVPDSGADHVAADLVVTARSEWGEDRIVRPVEVRRSYRLYLGSDKPLYQPGQTLHMRVLALDAGRNAPAAARAVQFEVQDPAGRTAFRQAASTSAYGIAAAEWALGADAARGEYRLWVALGDTVSEQTVTVGRYERPPFRVDLDLAQPYYLPGETVEGEVSASQFDGAAVGRAGVVVRAYLNQPARVQVAALHGRTDERGVYAFRFGLPSELGASEDQLTVEAEVRDAQGRGSWSGRVAPVAAEPLAVDVVAEGGRLRPGVENRVYILAARPDGAPAEAQLLLQVAGRYVPLETDAYGLATWRLTPDPGVSQVVVNVSAQDAQGRIVARTVTLSADQGPAQVLLRLDRASYQVGESVHLEVLAGRDEPVYVDVVHRERGQTLSTHVVRPVSGRAALAVDVSPQMAGTLELHAYQVLADGTLVRDSRLAVVQPVSGVEVELRADRASYRPGDVAHVAIAASVGGRPAEAALGIAVVDESIYALAERAPGFSKLFFGLEHGLYAPDTAASAEVQAAQDQAARAAWAGLPGGDLEIARSDPGQALGPAQARRQARVRGLAWGLAVALLGLAVALWGGVLARLRSIRERRAALWRTVSLVVGLAVLALLPLTLLVALAAWALLGAVAGWLLVVPLLAAWLVDLVVLALLFGRQRDDRGQVAVLLAAAYGVLSVLLGWTLAQGGGAGAFLAAAVALSWFGTWGALLAFAALLWFQGRRATSVGIVALILLAVALALLAGALLGPRLLAARAVTDPRLYAGPVGWLAGCAPAQKGAPAEATSAPAEQEKETVVVVTRLVEKEVEVTRVVEVTRLVEVEKEVEVTLEVEVIKEETLVVEAEATPSAPEGPSPQATPTAAPAPTSTAAPTATATPAPATEPALPTAQPTVAPAPPLPLLGQVAAETIYWVPEQVTDPQGRLAVEVALPGVPATWRMTVLASTLDGELGEATAILSAR